jgi:hypothetical protein
MVTRLLPLILVLLAGCAFSPPFSAPAVPVEVKEPVYVPVYCQPEGAAPPALPIATLTPKSAPADTMRAYVETVILLKALVHDRDTLIAGCAAPASAPPEPPQEDNAGDSVRVTEASAVRK